MCRTQRSPAAAMRQPPQPGLRVRCCCVPRPRRPRVAAPPPGGSVARVAGPCTPAFSGHAGRVWPLLVAGRLRALAALAVSASVRLVAGASLAAAPAGSVARTVRTLPERRAPWYPAAVRDPDSLLDELSVEAPGADELQVVPWPLLLRERVATRRRVERALPVDRAWRPACGGCSRSASRSRSCRTRSRASQRPALDRERHHVGHHRTAAAAFAVFGPAAGKLRPARPSACTCTAWAASACSRRSPRRRRTRPRSSPAAPARPSARPKVRPRLAIINRTFSSDQRPRRSAGGRWSVPARR